MGFKRKKPTERTTERIMKEPMAEIMEDTMVIPHGQDKMEEGEVTVVKNNSDFTKLMGLDVQEFGCRMHDRVVEETTIMSDKSQLDISDINRILSRYPRYFSWVIVESEVLNEQYEREKRKFEDWYKMKYMEASNTLPGKPTIAMVEANLVRICQTEVLEEHRRLNDEGVSESEIKEMLKYAGLSGKQNLLGEYQAKVNMAKGMVKVWSNTISSLQSLSKNITTELELVKRQVGA